MQVWQSDVYIKVNHATKMMIKRKMKLPRYVMSRAKDDFILDFQRNIRVIHISKYSALARPATAAPH